MEFSPDVLEIDAAAETDRICDFIINQVNEMRRDGAVVGLSGGIDSAVTAALCTRALGKERVLGLFMPERESNPVSLQYAMTHALQLGIKTETIDITGTLETLGTYNRRDELVKAIFPEYTPEYKLKITLPADLLAKDAYSFYSLTIENGHGIKTSRLDRDSLLGIVAATDTKLRTRMVNLYLYAEMNNYLVCGTTNHSEDALGYFVKYGDGGVDIEPLAYLYKMQIYQLGEFLGVPREIIERAPSADTFSFTPSDEEFYHRMPYHKLDPLLYAWENDVPIQAVCKAMSLTEDQVKRSFRDFTAKAAATKHVHSMPPVPLKV